MELFCLRPVSATANISPSEWSTHMPDTSNTIRDTVRDTVRDAQDAARESGKAASAASYDIKADVESLRRDVAASATRSRTFSRPGAPQPGAARNRTWKVWFRMSAPRDRMPSMPCARSATTWSMPSISRSSTALTPRSPWRWASDSCSARLGGADLDHLKSVNLTAAGVTPAGWDKLRL